MSFQVARDTRGSVPVREAASAAEADPAAREAAISERVEREVARIRLRAEADARARGEAMAQRAAELAEAAAAAKLAGALAALEAAWQQLAAPLARKEQDLSELVTALAFELARHLLGLELALRPESVAPLVDTLIAEAAQARGAQQTIVIRLNPADHAALEPRLAMEHAHLLGDAQIERGGAIVELIAASGDPIDKVEWDATLASRLASVRAALGLAAEPERGRVRRQSAA